MTVRRPSEQMPALERARAHAAHVLGPETAERLAMFHNGVIYVIPGRWARFLAWLVDVVVWVLSMGIGFFVAAVVAVAADLDNETGAPIGGVMLFLTPLLYSGFCFRDGRALGGVLTGTQVVRIKDGGRIGGWAAWAMLTRVLYPLLIIGAIIGALGGGGNAPSSDRVSVDARAIRRVHAGGIA
ncbi:RDD family protein [Lentzea californiensis]|uniref:RDD family protein n=1 Tax=Lentzea californiensis TaxID=438851 RepID=UPI0021665CF6|nr:RDD family protein [Lentzea californiensis]MCR3754391.1 RDD family protein [Lentzea californiensis]